MNGIDWVSKLKEQVVFSEEIVELLKKQEPLLNPFKNTEVLEMALKISTKMDAVKAIQSDLKDITVEDTKNIDLTEVQTLMLRVMYLRDVIRRQTEKNREILMAGKNQ